jgi:hypothetical protein
MKTRYNFTLSAETYSALKAISERDGISMSQVIESAIGVYDRPTDEITRSLLKVYDVISDEIQNLERIRDTNPLSLDIEENEEGDYLPENGHKLLELLYMHWEDLRSHPNFWEPKILHHGME